jgi:hypothetical protein
MTAEHCDDRCNVCRRVRTGDMVQFVPLQETGKHEWVAGFKLKSSPKGFSLVIDGFNPRSSMFYIDCDTTDGQCRKIYTGK